MKKVAGQLEPMIVFDAPQQESRMLSRHIETMGASRGELSILEAGCGNSWQLELPGVRYRLTGVDQNKRP